VIKLQHGSRPFSGRIYTDQLEAAFLCFDLVYFTFHNGKKDDLSLPQSSRAFANAASAYVRKSSVVRRWVVDCGFISPPFGLVPFFFFFPQNGN
jgi:hypothetical protein